MEPRIQYAKTTDGVGIAYYAIGEGPPLIWTTGIASHLHFEWLNPARRSWYERLIRDFRLVRFDKRGTGLSDRNSTDFSVEALARDIGAVADALGLEQFALWGAGLSSPPAISYAARNAERVSRLVLYHAQSRGSGLLAVRDDTMQILLEREWQLFTEVYSQQSYQFSESERVRAVAADMRESISQEAMQALLQQARQWDVTDMLPEIKCPALVISRPGWNSMGYDTALGHAVAHAIPGARLAILEGTDVAPYTGDIEPLLKLLHEFILGKESDRVGAEPSEAGALRIIFWTDVEGSTSLTQRLGDAAARDVLREHERITRGALKAHGGSEVKTMGDGFMASFGSATKALECAIAIQKAFAERNRGVGAEQLPDHVANSDEGVAVAQPLRAYVPGSPPVKPLRVRIGLNAGEPIAENDPDGRSDLFGTAVIVAARIAAQAQGGEILVSDVVRQLVAGKNFLFDDRGEQTLKGFEDPVRVYEVRWRVNE